MERLRILQPCHDQFGDAGVELRFDARIHLA
jgi:hypothetical protein